MTIRLLADLVVTRGKTVTVQHPNTGKLVTGVVVSAWLVSFLPKLHETRERTAFAKVQLSDRTTDTIVVRAQKVAD